MNLLMSISQRLLAKINISTIIKILEQTKNNIDGIEIASTHYSDMYDILKYTIKHNIIFQAHCPQLSDENSLKVYLNDVNLLSDIYGKPINIVFHSIENENLEKSLILTNEYMKNILEYINKNKLNITISLENLNFHHFVKRINLNLIDNILKNFNQLYFTYDIGHDLYDNKTLTKLSDLQINKINNVHIHNIVLKEDHHIIYENCETINELKQSIANLKEINFNGNIVKEEAVDRYKGENINEQMYNYILSFNDIKTILNCN